MAEEPPSEFPPLTVRTPHDVSVATFSTGAFVRTGRMVWLDFVQTDPAADEDNPRVTVVARIVLPPDAASDLAKRLAELGVA